MEKYYRGQAKNFSGNIKNGNDIIPSILRDKNNDFAIIDEYNYYLDCAKSMQEVLDTTIGSDDEITIKSLGMFQHYGIKTRLVDITKSKDVALYFASNQFFDEPGYIYEIVPGTSIKELKDDLRVSVTRKIQTILDSKHLINNKVNLFYYFKLRENTKGTIRLSSITDPVILDYDKLFTVKQKENLRINKQKGSFILLGNEVSNDRLTGKINRDIFTNLNDPIEVPAKDKLNNLFELTKKQINHVRLLPDSDLSIELTSKYNEIQKLNRFTSLERYTKSKFKYYSLDIKTEKEFVEFVDYLINNLDKLRSEFENQDFFSFIYKELVDYFSYYLEIRRREIISEEYIIVNYEEVFDLMYDKIKVA